MTRGRRRKPRVRRAIIVVPSLFTLANLFFGIWSIVLASQGSFYLASWWIVIAGVLDLAHAVYDELLAFRLHRFFEHGDCDVLNLEHLG